MHVQPFFATSLLWKEANILFAGKSFYNHLLVTVNAALNVLKDGCTAL